MAGNQPWLMGKGYLEMLRISFIIYISQGQVIVEDIKDNSVKKSTIVRKEDSWTTTILGNMKLEQVRQDEPKYLRI